MTARTKHSRSGRTQRSLDERSNAAMLQAKDLTGQSSGFMVVKRGGKGRGRSGNDGMAAEKMCLMGVTNDPKLAK